MTVHKSQELANEDEELEHFAGGVRGRAARKEGVWLSNCEAFERESFERDPILYH